jgi:hypothetical protein
MATGYRVVIAPVLFLLYSTVMSVACGAGVGEGGGKKTLARRNVVRAEVRLLMGMLLANDLVMNDLGSQNTGLLL